MADTILARMQEPLKRDGKLLDCRTSIGGAISIGFGESRGAAEAGRSGALSQQDLRAGRVQDVRPDHAGGVATNGFGPGFGIESSGLRLDRAVLSA